MWKIQKAIRKGDYLYALVKEHPKANKYGYVLHHRVVMENHLGRLLNPEEVVHHVNGDKHDNRIENLQVMTNQQHASHHQIEATSRFVRLKCPNCGAIFERERRQTHLAKGGKATFCSRVCNGKFGRRLQLNGLTIELERAVSENVLEEYRGKLRANSE